MLTITSLTIFLTAVLIGAINGQQVPVDTPVIRAKRTETIAPETVRNVEAASKIDDIAESIERLQLQLKDIQSQMITPDALDMDSEATGTVQKRQIGWQPLRKRKLAWQPLKKRNERIIEDHIQSGDARINDLPKFVIRLKDRQELKDQMLSVVEQHLLDDLNAAEQYGIKPETILADLRQRQQQQTNE